MKSWVSFVLIYFIRSNDFALLAAPALEPSDILTITGSRAYAVLWYEAHAYFTEKHKIIPQHVLVHRMTEQYASGGVQEEDLEELSEFIAYAYSIDEGDFDLEEAKEALERAVLSARVDHVMTERVAAGVSPKEIIEELAPKVQSANEASMATPVNPLDNLAELMDNMHCEPVGSNDVSYFNQLLGGGVTPGDVIGLVGPTGGNKTAIALDVVCSMATMGQNAVFMAYEQGFNTTNLPYRVLSRVSGIPLDRLRSCKKFNDLTQEEIQLYTKAKKACEAAKFYDFSAASHGISDIYAYVAKEKRERDVKLVVIDQLLSLVRRMPAVVKNPDAVSRVGEIFCGQLKTQVAEQLGVPILLIQQTTAAKSDMSPFTKPKMTETHYMKGFAQWIGSCINLGKMDKETRCFWAVTTKLREADISEGTELILHQKDGVRIQVASWMREAPENPGRFTEAGAENKMPQLGRAPTLGSGMTPGV